MGGGSTTPATSTTTVNNPQQQELYGLAMPFLKQFAQAPPSMPTGPTVAPFDPAQTAGQEQVLGAAAGPQQNLADIGSSNAQFLSGDVLSPESNPALKQYMETATQPIWQGLTEQALPAIRGEAIKSGGFGGSRQGIAEGLATGRAAQAAGNVTADIANKGYAGGLEALVKNLALLPQTQQAQLAPGLSTSGVGDVRQSMAQKLMGDVNLRELYPQLLPLLMGQSIAGIGSGMAPSGTTTTGTSSQGDPLMQGLGLGIQGLSAMMPLIMMSDRRLKRRINLVGHLRNGVPVYRFRFRGSETEHVGFMADRVPLDCVIDVLGFKAVDYGKVLEGARHGV